MTPEAHRREFPTRWIELSTPEQGRARALGMQRHYGSKAQGLTDFLGEHEAQSDIAGAFGEFGGARYLSLPEPNSINAFGAPDLPPDFGVRCRTKWHYELNVRPRDHTEYRYLLVTWLPPFVVVRGWMPGAQVKRYPLKDVGGYNRPAHFVPPDDLRPPEELIDRGAFEPITLEDLVQLGKEIFK